jgi:hypothetical protein
MFHIGFSHLMIFLVVVALRHLLISGGLALFAYLKAFELRPNKFSPAVNPSYQCAYFHGYLGAL